MEIVLKFAEFSNWIFLYVYCKTIISKSYTGHILQVFFLFLNCSLWNNLLSLNFPITLNMLYCIDSGWMIQQSHFHFNRSSAYFCFTVQYTSSFTGLQIINFCNRYSIIHLISFHIFNIKKTKTLFLSTDSVTWVACEFLFSIITGPCNNFCLRHFEQ